MLSDLHTQLLALAEPDFAAFQRRLLPGVENLLGVRLPALRKLARGICRQDDWRAMLADAAPDESYEQTMLRGMVIGYADAPPEEILRHTADFIPRIDNWSVCDSFCSGLKLARTLPEQVWTFLSPYLQDPREFHVRFGVVMLIFYYVNESYLANTLQVLSQVCHTGYYAQMAVAWAFSVCFACFPAQTAAHLHRNPPEEFILRKTLQKIRESHRVGAAEYALLKGI